MSVGRVRGAGSAAINMCLVASGCVEAYYEMGIHIWDVAASSLIVSEAGGVLMDVEGKDTQTEAQRFYGDVLPDFHRVVCVQVER